MNYALPLTRTHSTVRDFFSLLKPGVMSLVVFTGFAGMWLAPGALHPFLQIVAIFCIALGSGAAGAINMWYDRDIDAHMLRTMKRPIPSGRIAPEIALEFGVIGAFLSVFIMAVAVNFWAAGLLLAGILFYVFIYTAWLKRSTPQNIVIGGAAGAFPPVIGWLAVTNQMQFEPWILFLITFLWTPPHFWALALKKSREYAKVGVPMLPVTHGILHTKWQILRYTVWMLLVSLLPTVVGMSGYLYLAGAVALGGVFLWMAHRLYRDEDIKRAMPLFGYSIFYLFALYGLLILDHFLRMYI